MLGKDDLHLQVSYYKSSTLSSVQSFKSLSEDGPTRVGSGKLSQGNLMIT